MCVIFILCTPCLVFLQGSHYVFVTMLHRRWDSGGFDDVVDEKTGKTGFAIVDNGEFWCIISSHGELFWVANNGIAISDDFRGKVKEFDGGEELTIFWCDIYDAIWLSGAKFDVYRSDVSIVLILYFYSVCYIAVIIILIGCVVWIFRNKQFAILG